MTAIESGNSKDFGTAGVQWVPDYKFHTCMLCSKSFSLLRRRHHCRSCGSLVCGNCSPNTWKLKDEKNSRVCINCYSTLSTSKSTVINTTNTNPYYHCLRKADWNAWYATFDTYWLKSNHTEFYEEEKKRLLQIQKSTAEKEQQTRKTSLSSNSSSINPKSDENHNKNKYQRQQKSRYANSHQQTSSPTVVKKNAHMLALKNRIAIVENGILWINVMEAVGIPDCDTFSLPDCYCKYYITSNDPCFNHKYYTKVKDNTKHPIWNDDATLVITNSTGSIIVELWDSDTIDPDDFLGVCEIKLRDIFLHFKYHEENADGNVMIDDWFKIDLLPQYKLQLQKKYDRYLRHMHNENQIQSNLNIVKLERMPTYKRLKSMPLLEDRSKLNKFFFCFYPFYLLFVFVSCLISINVPLNGCYIHLQFKLHSHSNWMGNFISYFDPIPPPKLKSAPFDINIFYSQVSKLLFTHLWPMVEVSQESMNVLFWNNYYRALFCMCFYLYGVYHPWIFMFYFQFKLLMYICNSYVKQTVLANDGQGRSMNLPVLLHGWCVFIGVIPFLLSGLLTNLLRSELSDENSEELNDVQERENAESTVVHDTQKLQLKNAMKITDEMKEEELNTNDMEHKMNDVTDIDLGAFVHLIGNNAIRVSGLKNDLQRYQELLIWMNKMIEYIMELFSWKWKNISSLIVISLSISCALLFLFRNYSIFYKFELAVFGVLILGYFSKPMQFLLWMIFGFSNFYYDFHIPYNKLFTVDYHGFIGFQRFLFGYKYKKSGREMERNNDNLSDIQSKNRVMEVSIKIWSAVRLILLYIILVPKNILSIIVGIFSPSSMNNIQKEAVVSVSEEEKEVEVEHSQILTPTLTETKSPTPMQLQTEKEEKKQQLPSHKIIIEGKHFTAEQVNNNKSLKPRVKSRKEVGDILRRKTYSASSGNSHLKRKPVPFMHSSRSKSRNARLYEKNVLRWKKYSERNHLLNGNGLKTNKHNIKQINNNRNGNGISSGVKHNNVNIIDDSPNNGSKASLKIENILREINAVRNE